MIFQQLMSAINVVIGASSNGIINHNHYALQR